MPAASRGTEPGLVQKIKLCGLSQLPELILVWALGVQGGSAHWAAVEVRVGCLSAITR